MITGLNVTIGVYVLVFAFSGYLFLEKYLEERKAKRENLEEVAQAVRTGAVDVRLSPTEKWDAHVESISK